MTSDEVAGLITGVAELPGSDQPLVDSSVYSKGCGGSTPPRTQKMAALNLEEPTFTL